jgi:TrmH family RNA methyltransferase
VKHTDWDWTRASALVLGPESTGLSDEEMKATDQAVSIPMHGEVESLNVSVATGILLYEAARQRSA